MNSMVCGHERDVLRWAIRMMMAPTVAISTGLRSGKTAKSKALADAHDPAIVAKMMVVEGRRLGLSVAMFDHANYTRYDNDIIVRVDNLHIVVTSRSEVIFADMPQVHALLRAWLDLADGDSDGALRAMGGEA